MLSCSCSLKCLGGFSDVEKLTMLQLFCDMESKDQQDLHLQRLMEIQPVSQKGGRKKDIENSKPKSSTVEYVERRIKVCKNAFLSIYGVSKQLFFPLKNYKSPRDLCGKNGSRNALKGNVIANIRTHIESLSIKLSHYTSQEIRYLDSRFGRPATDTCTAYKELNAKIMSETLNENAKRVAVAEVLVHKIKNKSDKLAFLLVLDGQFEEIAASINMQIMAYETYSCRQQRVIDVTHKTARQTMEHAGKEEAALARQLGEVDKN
ncbi:hypothetical protein ILUMI_26327 [Ignelater luminosus]|uniref:Uncharacterized protein n=1 Tax=Ignelater luminosus TaxID=2038154 RepID=A0A8K0C871_IGNLU|nr:hypothetical protein ILUMI_26327 [Ignelater luminosus]